MEAGDALFVDLPVGRKFHRSDRLSRDLFQSSQAAAIAWVDEEDRHPGSPGAAGSPDAVDVRFRIDGQVIVNDVTDALHIKAARCDIGGDQNIDFARLQTLD